MKVLVFILTTILIDSGVNGNDIEYSKCLETKVLCQSLPANCLQENSKCDVLLIASPMNTSPPQKGVMFEMFGRIDKNKQWFAMGLSSDKEMGNDSVTEIYVSNDGKSQAMRQSWNTDTYNNEIISKGVEGITQIGNVINSDGILRAKWSRSAVTEVHSNPFDIMNNKYNILLAVGALDSDNKKQIHSEKSVSETEVDLNFGITQTLKDLYKNCKNSETNLCFGLPDNCIESQNCHLVLAVTKSGYGMSSGTVSFQMIGKSDDSNSGWIAMALSDDNQMGSDSVVECLVLSNSTTLLRNSWNTDDDDNQVIGDIPGITRTGPVVNEDGWINCKWTRTAQTKVKNVVFDLIKKKYYILLAKGSISDQKSGTKSMHSEKLSSKQAVSLESQQNTTTTTIGTTNQPITSTVGTTNQPITSTEVPSSLMSNAYKRCQNNQRLCFGVNDKQSKQCIESKDCALLFSSVSISKSEGTVEIELFWNRDSSSSDRWAAVAFSDDQKMGLDSVSECIVKSNGSTTLKQGWNPNGHKATIDVSDPSISFLNSSFKDGIVYCKWQRKAVSIIEGHNINILNNSYFLLLGHGPLNSDETKIQRHTDIQWSSKKVNLQTVGMVTTGATKIYVQMHATFMIIGWLGCVSIAILLARYYKNSWPDSTLCGVKIWFAFHRSVMVFGVVLVLTSTVIIFVNKGWVVSSAHTIVGLISIILCFLQPIGALFRPNPDAPNRPIFNYLHWSGGYIGYILSFVAICLSTNFSNLLPKQSLWVLIAYISVYILSHVLHHLKSINISLFGDKQKRRETLIDTSLALFNVAIILVFVLTLVILLFV